MTSRFRKAEIINIEGFEIPTYKSLLAGERIAILEARRKNFDVTLEVLNLRKKLCAAFDIEDESELQEKIQSLDNNSYEGDNREIILDLLKQFQNINNPEEQNRKFAEESVCLFLSSRIDPKWFNEVAPELKSEFPFDYSKKEIDEYLKVEKTERLGHPTIIGIYKRLIKALPDTTFLKISNLIDAEIEGLSLDEYEAKLNTQEQEEDLDPKA